MSRSAPGGEDAPVRAADIATIDFARFRDGDAASRRGVAAEIAVACRATGFFRITGHRVPAAIEQAAFAQTAAFFALPQADKRAAQATADWYRGWVPAPAGRRFDQYRLLLPAPAAAAPPPHAMFDAPNRWPPALPGFRPAIDAYLAEMAALTAELLRAFALALGLDEARFAPWFRAPPSQLSLLHYPPLPAGAAADVASMVPHTDEGPFTILAQRDVGGLEVRADDGWIAVPPCAGALTINLGDMMRWWSNGRLVARAHRVRNLSGGVRHALAFFVSPDRETVVAPLPELVGADGPRYPPVCVADHFARFYATLEGGPVT